MVNKRFDTRIFKKDYSRCSLHLKPIAIVKNFTMIQYQENISNIEE